MFNSYVCLPEGTQVSLTQSFNTHNMGLAQTPEIGWFIEMINLVLPVAPHLRKSSPYPCIQQSASSLIHASKDSEIQGFVLEISTHHGGKHQTIRTWGASITCTRSTFQAASGRSIDLGTVYLVYLWFQKRRCKLGEHFDFLVGFTSASGVSSCKGYPNAPSGGWMTHQTSSNYVSITQHVTKPNQPTMT